MTSAPGDGDRAPRSRRLSKPGVRADEPACECFGQRNIGRVIGREVVAEPPDPRQEADRGNAAQPEPRPAINQSGNVRADLAAEQLCANSVDDL